MFPSMKRVIVHGKTFFLNELLIAIIYILFTSVTFHLKKYDLSVSNLNIVGSWYSNVDWETIPYQHYESRGKLSQTDKISGGS